MSSAVQVKCRGCGGAIVAPGPRITFTGVDGEFHVMCVTSAAVLYERNACMRIALEYGGRDAEEIAEMIGKRSFAQ